MISGKGMAPLTVAGPGGLMRCAFMQLQGVSSAHRVAPLSCLAAALVVGQHVPPPRAARDV